MAAETKCSKIVSSALMGHDYVIEGNRRVWYTEDGRRWVEEDLGWKWHFASDGRICRKDGNRYGGGLFC
jgi:hypothetical protein